MWTREPETLRDMFGAENSARLSLVYKDVLASVTKGRGDPIPSRAVRLAIVTALLAEADQGEFDPARLKRAALSAVEASVFG